MPDKGRFLGIVEVTGALKADGRARPGDGPDTASALVAESGCFRKVRRAGGSTDDETDDETWEGDGLANTLNGFDVGDARTTHAIVEPVATPPGVDLYNQELTGEQHAPLRTAGGHSAPAVAIADVAGTLRGGGSTKASKGAPSGQDRGTLIHSAGDPTLRVRRLTPRECERLQGFPDDYTRIPYRGRTAELCPDGPRYRAIGNSMAVPVMRWIGQRIDFLHRRLAAGADHAAAGAGRPGYAGKDRS